MNKTSIFFAVIAVICIGALILGHYNEWKKKKAAEVKAKTLADELSEAVDDATRQRIMHEGDAEYHASQADYFLKRRTRLMMEMQRLSGPIGASGLTFPLLNGDDK